MSDIKHIDSHWVEKGGVAHTMLENQGYRPLQERKQWMPIQGKRVTLVLMGKEMP